LAVNSEDDQPQIRDAMPSEYAKSQANGELASINTASVVAFKNSVAPRLADVKGNGNDPFVLAIAGHSHQSQIGGFGYSSDLYGIAGGADYSFKLGNECYTRVGAVVGYINGDTEFTGSSIGRRKTAKQDVYTASLFAAYESFNAKNLKTNASLFIGTSYTKTKLFRIDGDNHAFHGRMSSINEFVSFEAINNLYYWKGAQFGLWFKADYNHIRQNGYSETSTAATGCQHVSKIDFDFFNTTIGINIEKEIQHAARQDSRLRLYLKAGWNAQLTGKHSDGTVSIDGTHFGSFSPTLGSPSRHSAVLSAGFRNKLNSHWDVVGEWDAHVSKDQTNNTVLLGVGYTF
jgi:hypothetical protein